MLDNMNKVEKYQHNDLENIESARISLGKQNVAQLKLTFVPNT